MMEHRVTSAVTGATMKLSLALGARLKPIGATIRPVTTGGMSLVTAGASELNNQTDQEQ